MQRYNINNRLAYLSGGVQSAGGMWPSVAAGDWWDVAGETCVIAYQPKGAASYAASLVNLANSGTYDAAAGTAPAWDATNGWQFDRTSSEYLTTGFAPGDGDYTTIVRFAGRNIQAADQALFGSRSDFTGGTWYFLYVSRSFDNDIIWIQYGGSIGNVGTYSATSGVLALTPTYVYYDKTQASNGGGTWSGTNVDPILIGSFDNHTSGPAAYTTINVLAFAVYDGELTSGQISDLTDAMNAL